MSFSAGSPNAMAVQSQTSFSSGIFNDGVTSEECYGVDPSERVSSTLPAPDARAGRTSFSVPRPVNKSTNFT